MLKKILSSWFTFIWLKTLFDHGPDEIGPTIDQFKLSRPSPIGADDNVSSNESSRDDEVNTKYQLQAAIMTEAPPIPNQSLMQRSDIQNDASRPICGKTLTE